MHFNALFRHFLFPTLIISTPAFLPYIRLISAYIGFINPTEFYISFPQLSTLSALLFALCCPIPLVEPVSGIFVVQKWQKCVIKKYKKMPILYIGGDIFFYQVRLGGEIPDLDALGWNDFQPTRIIYNIYNGVGKRNAAAATRAGQQLLYPVGRRRD